MAKTQRRNARNTRNVTDTNVTTAQVETPEPETKQETERKVKYATRAQRKYIEVLTAATNDGNSYMIPKDVLEFDKADELIKRAMKGEEIDWEEEVPGGSWKDFERVLSGSTYEKKDYGPVLERAVQEGEKAMSKSKKGRLSGVVVIQMADGRHGFARLLRENELNSAEDKNDYEVRSDASLEEKIDFAKAFAKQLFQEDIECEIVSYPDMD